MRNTCRLRDAQGIDMGLIIYRPGIVMCAISRSEAGKQDIKIFSAKAVILDRLDICHIPKAIQVNGIDRDWCTGPDEAFHLKTPAQQGADGSAANRTACPQNQYSKRFALVVGVKFRQ